MIYVILCSLSSQEAVDPDQFQAYCRETAKLYVSQYAWYPMPASCYKILVHGHQAMREKPVPVGLLSEECQEVSNKVVKICVCFVGMVVFLLISEVITPPAVSIPRDSGATSSRSRSPTLPLSSPLRMAAWTAAP